MATLAKHGLVDHRTDIYALGATLYELLTGRAAVDGKDRAVALRQIAFEEPPPPRSLNRRIPADLETVVLKAVAKAPAERYATAQGLADDLRRILDGRPIQARRPTLVQRATKALWRHRALAATVAAGLVAALVVLAISTVWVIIKNGEKETALQQARENLEETKTERERVRKTLKFATAQMEPAFLRTVEQLQAGNRREAMTSARNLANAWEQVVAVDPDDVKNWQSLFSIQFLVGSLLWQEGKVDQSAGAFARAVAVAEKMVALKPEFTIDANDPSGSVAGSRQSLADALVRLGTARRASGRYSDGVEALQRAADTYRELADEIPRAMEKEILRLNADAGPEGIATIRAGVKAGTDAFSWIEKVHEAETRVELAELLTEAGHLENAQTALNDATRILGDLPLTPLATPLTLLQGKRCLAQANLDWTAGRRDKAEAQYRAVLSTWEATDEKSDRGLRREFAWLLATCPILDVRDPRRAVRLLEAAEGMEMEQAKAMPGRSSFSVERPGDYWLALGAAHYFAGDAEAAVAALERALWSRVFAPKTPPPGRDFSKHKAVAQTAYDYFLFAMAKAKQGDKEQARRWFDKGVAWMEKNRPGCDELRRFRAEAADLMKLENAPKPQPQKRE